MNNIKTYKELTNQKLFNYFNDGDPLDIILIYLNDSRAKNIKHYHGKLIDVVYSIAKDNNFVCRASYENTLGKTYYVDEPILDTFSSKELREYVNSNVVSVSYYLTGLLNGDYNKESDKLLDSNSSMPLDSLAAIKYMLKLRGNDDIVMLAGDKEIAKFIHTQGQSLLDSKKSAKLNSKILKELTKVIKYTDVFSLKIAQKEIMLEYLENY